MAKERNPNYLTGKQILTMLIVPAILLTFLSWRSYKQGFESKPRSNSSSQYDRLEEKAYSDLLPFVETLVKYKVKGIEGVNYKSHYLMITVSNSWHILSYQTRLQGTQDLWKIWANIHSPNNRDSARIKIVDINGNIVGGSRALAGSLIWVQDK